MSLADRLLEQPNPDEPQYTPHFEFDPRSGEGTISTGPMPISEEFNFDEVLRRFNKDPAVYELVVEPAETIWEQSRRNRDTNEFETVLLHAWKNARFQRKTTTSTTELDAIVKRARAERRPGTGPHWFIFQAGDLQLGKRSRDGSTEEILERYFQSVEAAKEEFATLKRLGVEGIQVSMPGDCLEGNQSQSGRNLWLTQQTITEQVVMFQRLIMLTVEAFAPLTERVFIDVCNGNHDESQRQQSTYPGDGWATTAATLVSDSLKHNPLAFGHIEVRVPEKWSGHMTVPVGDTIVTVVHGHQWRRDKAMDWWANQAIGNHPPGAAQLLQHGHWHEFMVRTNADRTVVTSPTFDCGSDWYRNKTGATSRRGAAVYLLRDGDVSRMSVV